MSPIDLVLAAVSWNSDNQTVVPIIHIADLHSGGFAREMELFPVGRPAPRTNLEPGGVYGVRGLKLKMGAGPEHSSVISAQGRDLYLNRLTEFLLVPSSVAFLSTPVSLSSSNFAEAISASETSAGFTVPSFSSAASYEFEPCTPPLCNTDLPPADTEISGHPTKSIAIRPLGYSPRPQREISELDNDEEVAWLGDNRILLAFNPHRLVRRSGTDSATAPIRTIHAVLLDIEADRILGTADWELPDSGKFLWQLSQNRLLIHAGNELRIYDEHLTPVSRLALDGPLAFVRISPNGGFISIGTLHERHTPELHDRLRESLDRDPEEDVIIAVLDKTFQPITRASVATETMPPMLLDEGQLRLLAHPGGGYSLNLLTWENRDLTLARFTSTCIPEISTFPPDMLSVRSCHKINDSIEFRVLRAGGQVVVRGRASPRELGQEADGNRASETFAVRTIEAASAVHAGFAFHGSELLTQEIRIYRASDGRRLASIRAEAPAPSRGGYALSPDGSRLAVIGDAVLSIYPVPTH